MAKKTARKPTARATPDGRGAAVLAKLALALLVAGGLVVGLARLGRHAGEGVAARDRYTVPVSAVRFDTPPHLDPKTFLTEVRYLGDLPETVQAVDPHLGDKLAVAFRRHPWVADVTGVSVSPEGEIRLGLQFRVPALAVRWANGAEREVRAVDASGVLLPAGAPTDPLPQFLTTRTIPLPEAGKVWPEADVVRAAELVGRNPTRSIERTPTGWRLVDPAGKAFTLTAH